MSLQEVGLLLWLNITINIYNNCIKIYNITALFHKKKRSILITGWLEINILEISLSWNIYIYKS